MNKYIFLIILMAFPSVVWGSFGVNETEMISYPGGKCYIFRLKLADKKNTPYRLDKPLDFLSQRSIDRRKKQHLAIDSTDLPISPAYLSAISANQKIHIVGKSKWNNSVLIKCSHPNNAYKLLKLPFVKNVVQVFSSPDSISNSTRSSFKKEFNRWDTIPDSRYGVAVNQITSLGGDRLHAVGYRGKGKIIAVLDAGFMNVDKIPALHQIKIAGIDDFVVPKSKNIFAESDHGTMVLSLMATDLPGTYIGTAPDASYMLLRCEDTHTESLSEEDYWAEAVEYADSVGADIVNSSLGYHDFDDPSTNHKYYEMDGMTTFISLTASMLANKGMILVNSAGNDGMGTWKKLNFPADARNIITVGAITPHGDNAAFSAVGPTADGRIKPDVMAYGSPAVVISGRGTIVDDMGTSFSAPLISGMVACLWQALPDKTAKEIIDIVIHSGNNAHPDNVYGYGVPDFQKAYNSGKR